MRIAVSLALACAAATMLAGCGDRGTSGSTSTSTATTVSTTTAGSPVAPAPIAGAGAQTPAGAPTLAAVDGVIGPTLARYQQQCTGGDRTACALQTNLQGTQAQLRQWAASCAGGNAGDCTLYAQNARAIMLMPSLTGEGVTPANPPPAGDGGARSIPQAQAAEIQMAAGALRRAIATAQQRCQGGDQTACGQGQQLQAVQQHLYRLFQSCSAGDQNACSQHDQAVARIAAAARNAQGSEGSAPQTSNDGSAFSQQ